MGIGFREVSIPERVIDHIKLFHYRMIPFHREIEERKVRSETRIRQSRYSIQLPYLVSDTVLIAEPNPSSHGFLPKMDRGGGSGEGSQQMDLFGARDTHGRRLGATCFKPFAQYTVLYYLCCSFWFSLSLSQCMFEFRSTKTFF